MKSGCFSGCFLAVICLAIQPVLAGENQSSASLLQSFAGRYGQIEVGGIYAGAEFHLSRPLPSRISFYYPVANSLDLSTDYWKRDQSVPLRILLRLGDQVDTVGVDPWEYSYTPYSVVFEKHYRGFCAEISYHFCQTIPVVVWQISITNQRDQDELVRVETALQPILRTCQTYAWKEPHHIESFDKKNESCDRICAFFPTVDTDSTAFFVVNAAAPPVASPTDSLISFQYEHKLAPHAQYNIIQLLGTCKTVEVEAVMERASLHWQREVAEQESRLHAYAVDSLQFHIPDPDLLQTARWSRAVLASNFHFLHDAIVPMPCPAEYNFFFTHDALLTDLGAVHFDIGRVKNDLLYLKSLAKADSILPHAYYWRDHAYETEFCTSDNWNHLWFILTAASYLRHSGDVSTVADLDPLLQKSLGMMLENKGVDDLMYAFRPDWWDIGHIYGARAYITTLMIRALREFVFIKSTLGRDQHALGQYLDLAQRMQRQLVSRLWDDEAGFLFNMLDSTRVDRHYYAGSLLAAAWHILDDSTSMRLIQTATTQLLDSQVGIRIAMPADFHLLIDEYRFNGLEMGGPYLYINGGVWPHGIAWYALGWLAVAEPDAAYNIVSRYMTLQGVRNSPNGQPSFFEYRRADSASPRYGEIDKPTFLWAGGWFLHTLYQLAGLRENEWNICFSPRLPQDWRNMDYHVMIKGGRTHVFYEGTGRWFKEIRGDGERLYAAVIDKPFARLLLKRGRPTAPYVATANAVVKQTQYNQAERILKVNVTGIPDQPVHLEIISPYPLDKKQSQHTVQCIPRDTIYQINADFVLDNVNGTCIISFQR